MVRGPLGRYSGRRAAIAATIVGVIVFATEGGILWSYLSHRRADRFSAMQASAADDLRTLLRTERLYKAAQDRFGTIKESRFSPRGGYYTIYLALDDYIPAVRDGDSIVDRLPSDATPKLSDTSFTAFAVANLDGDSDLDVWMVDESGELRHVHNDVPWLPPPREVSAPPGQDVDHQPETPPLAEGDKTPEVKPSVPVTDVPPNSDKSATTKTPDSKPGTSAPADDTNGKANAPADDKSTKASTGAPAAADKTTTANESQPRADDKATAERSNGAGADKKAPEPPAPKPVPFKLDKPPLGNPNAPPIKPPSTSKPAVDPGTADKPVTPT
jgi:hypothetical protein